MGSVGVVGFVQRARIRDIGGATFLCDAFRDSLGRCDSDALGGVFACDGGVEWTERFGELKTRKGVRGRFCSCRIGVDTDD